jgi:RNA polymerase primary sigma factor
MSQQQAKLDILTREQEIELSKLIEGGDQSARKKMISANLRLAASIAKKYANKGIDFEDLMQESTIGLMKAVDRFDWRKGFKFSTYAYWWILQTVKQYVASNKGPIALPANANARLFQANCAKEEFEKEFGISPSETELAEILGTTADTLQSLRKSSAQYLSLDSAIVSGSDDKRTLQDTLADPSPSPEEALELQEVKKAVSDALSSLSHREQTVLRLRFGIEPN